MTGRARHGIATVEQSGQGVGGQQRRRGLSDRGQLFQLPGKDVLDDVFGCIPLRVARSCSLLAVSADTCTSMRLLYGFSAIHGKQSGTPSVLFSGNEPV